MRANNLKIGMRFKQRSPVSGTNVYEVVGNLRPASRGEYALECKVVSTTDEEWNEVGRKETVFFAVRRGVLKKVTIVS